MKVDRETSINIPKIITSIRNNRAFGMFVAETWYKLYEDYVPWREGVLYDTVRLSPWEIDHIAPYAAEVYEHNRNYRRDKHPRATAHWSEAAEPAELDKLTQSIQNYINMGRLSIDD